MNQQYLHATMMRRLMSCRVMLLLVWVLVMLLLVEVELAEGGVTARNYISWDDLVVDEQRLEVRSPDDGRVIIVNQNGGGHSKTVQGAVNMVPHNNKERVKIYIYPGIYREKVHVPESKPYVSFIGKRNGTATPVITWNSKSSDKGPNGKELGTFASATVGVDANYFCATGISFENSVIASAGEIGMQGVALRVHSEKAMFYRVRIKGTQDSLLDYDGNHYFLKCHIIGTVDFICGNAKSFYEKCLLESIAEKHGAIAAHRRELANDTTGFSFVGCSIRGSGKVYLGRAWGNYSTIVYSKCNIDDIIKPEGWSDWNHPHKNKTALFAEYQCKGRGADRRGRVPWSKSFTYHQAKPFLSKTFIDDKHHWLRL